MIAFIVILLLSTVNVLFKYVPFANIKISPLCELLIAVCKFATEVTLVCTAKEDALLTIKKTKTNKLIFEKKFILSWSRNEQL